jgi:hypothetical protein
MVPRGRCLFEACDLAHLNPEPGSSVREQRAKDLTDTHNSLKIELVTVHDSVVNKMTESIITLS